jgi:MerR family transcriptional regulator, light-induced transcriptional regulator
MSPAEQPPLATGELLSVAAVARRIGVAPATLRTWARRYGIGPTEHEAGSHRKYCPSDLAKLTVMRRLISSGVAPADAAEQAKAHEGEVIIEEFTSLCRECDETIDAIFNASEALDSLFVETMLRNEISENGIISAWQEVFVPVLIQVGAAWEKSGKGIEVEHMLTEILKRVLRESTSEIVAPVNTRPVLLASVGEELHSLALHALAAALAERGIETHFLGARTPVEAISSMVSRFAPPAVFLWAQLPVNGDPKFVTGIPAVRPAPRVIIGGPGWNPDKCQDAHFVGSLTLAVDEIAMAVGA